MLSLGMIGVIKTSFLILPSHDLAWCYMDVGITDVTGWICPSLVLLFLHYYKSAYSRVFNFIASQPINISKLLFHSMPIMEWTDKKPAITHGLILKRSVWLHNLEQSIETICLYPAHRSLYTIWFIPRCQTSIFFMPGIRKCWYAVTVTLLERKERVFQGCSSKIQRQ